MCLCAVFGRSTYRRKCLCVHIYTVCGQTQDVFLIIYYYILGLVSSCMMLVLSVCLQLPPILLKTEINTYLLISHSHLTVPAAGMTRLSRSRSSSSSITSMDGSRNRNLNSPLDGPNSGVLDNQARPQTMEVSC